MMLNAVIGLMGGGLLLDRFPGASVAYSVQKLKSSYSGFCMRVRRSSDNTEQDIGFSGGALDETSLLAFVGAGNGFVVRWYDQSGNTNTATQNTAASQAQIVVAGVVNKVNGIPSLLRATVTTMTTSNITHTTPWSLFTVLKRTSAATDGSRLQGPGGQALTVAWLTDNKLYSASQTNALAANAADSGTAKVLLSAIFNASSKKQYKNGTEITSTMSVVADVGLLSLLVLNGNTQELIYYPTDQLANKTLIESNINTRYTIF